jgi:hypothetical protein
VEKVAAAGQGRVRKAPGVKKLVRTAEAAAAAGAAIDQKLAQSASTEEVSFDPNSNVKSLDQLLDDSDPSENRVPAGLVIAGAEDEE